MKEIILYGIGIEGEKFFWAYRNYYRIIFCIDRICYRSFHNIPVYDLSDVTEELKNKKRLVVIAANAYEEISINLQKYGLREYEDYIGAKDIGKKLAIFYGNCHMGILCSYLRNNPDFNRKYIIKNFFLQKERISENILKRCELLVVQDIRKENRYGYIDAESFCNMVSKNCLCIKIPNVYGKNFFFPQFKNSSGEECCGMACSKIFERHVNPNAVVVYEKQKRQKIGDIIRGLSSEGGDANIERLYEENKTIEEIVDFIENGEAYNPKNVLKRFNEEMKKLIEREKQCDICISDYILENFQSKQLFFEPNHPTAELIKEKGRRILKLLNIEIDESIPISYELDAGEIFIYGCVKKALGIMFEQKYIRKVNYLEYTLKGRPMDIEEYVETYVNWVCEKE